MYRFVLAGVLAITLGLAAQPPPTYGQAPSGEALALAISFFPADADLPPGFLWMPERDEVIDGERPVDRGGQPEKQRADEQRA